jgi:signal transduction histidine kinase/ActR/RegA family two-component response regulator
MSQTTETSSNRFFTPFLWTTTAVGAFVIAYSFYKWNFQRLDTPFAILGISLLLTSRIGIRIPHSSSQISVSDIFIFLALVVYGGDSAVLLAAFEALLSTLRFSRKIRTIAFNWGVAACSTFITSKILQVWFGDVASLIHKPFEVSLVVATCVMALVQYSSNSGIVGIGSALKMDQPLWKTWSRQYLWTSLTYFAGAFAAVIIAKLIAAIGFYAVIITFPIIAIVFLTYRTYLKNVETSAAHAEQAEKHVEELSHYIEEQDRIREQFSQIEKLSALGELASGVAHDFNNTLAGILGRAQLLLRTNDPDKIQRGLNIIIKSAEDGAKTVKRIQDFARQRRDHDFEPICLDQLLLDVSEITRPRWKDRAEASNIHINVDLQIRSKSNIMGDDSELREVLVNMVFNAVDAMPNGGQLTLSAEDVGESVVISVVDTGIGMGPEVRSRIFDPFFTTKGKAGLGLGLAVSFGIIRRHEGVIEVQSEIGKGTAFHISLPIAKVSEDSLPSGTSSEQSYSVGQPITSAARLRDEHQPNILVVDDEESVRELLRDLLENEGCRVYLADGGREALALFDARQFDAVFTDIGMPGMSGWELARAIRERSEMIPIAVITGWGQAVGSNEQKEAGVDWVVTKPFTMARITELAQEIQRRRTIAVKRAAFSIVAA